MTAPTKSKPDASNSMVDDPIDQSSFRGNKRSLKKPVFWVEVSPLVSKEVYKEADVEMVSDSLDSVPVEVVGEIRLDNYMYYWVRHDNDIIHRQAAIALKNEYPDLLNVYTKAKATGMLPEFDPDSTQVHPKDRIRRARNLTQNLTRPLPLAIKKGPPRGVPKRKASIPKPQVAEDYYESNDSESASEDDYEQQDDWSDRGKRKAISQPTRRSGRNTRRSNYREPSLSPVKTRISARTRQSRHSATEVEEDEEFDELEDDSDGINKVEQPKKQRIRGRLARSAYGNIRLIADLSENESEDDYPLHIHRNFCDKCQDPPAHVSLNHYFTKLKRKVRGKKPSQDEEREERFRNLGGWVRCLKCSVAMHWRCIPKAQRDEIMKAAKKRAEEAEKEGLTPRRVETLGAYDTTDFFCNACIQGGICMYCKEVATAPEESAFEFKQNVSVPDTPQTPVPSDNVNKPSSPSVQPADTANPTAEHQHRELLFRCQSCKRLAHYAHFPQPEPDNPLSTIDLAAHYQQNNLWKCTECISFVYQVDKIVAWRPYPANATEPSRQSGVVDPKALLPREYLVKWIDRSYRRVDWVPHMWLLSTAQSKLKNFLTSGPRITLLDTPSDLDNIEQHDSPPNEQMLLVDSNFLIPDNAGGQSFARNSSEEHEGPAGPLPDAERRIPPGWKTVERILDVYIWNPLKRPKKRTHRSKRSKQKRAETESEVELNSEVEGQRDAAYDLGQEPDARYLETIDEWETRNEQEITAEQAPDVIWVYVKWSELGYDDATWDTPPRPSEPDYDAYKRAFERFLSARQVVIKKKSKKEAEDFDNRPIHAFEQKKLALTADPELAQEGRKLMDFQLTGVNWLFRNWWKKQPSILADDMGLGKTVQLSTLVGYLVQTYKACPVLIVVPNSTITNWLRELASWAPHLTVVPYYGDAKSRDIIRSYELFHDAVHDSSTRLKFHVLLATYESAASREFSTVFKSVQRWELLVVDEAQRLKNDAGLLFKRLNEMNAVYRILMTGTPLNNNIRELFNLMNFLDPKEFNDSEALEKEYENITEDKLTVLREKLKPYFLRRTKADVLKLPPKNEVIVPISMTSLQKELYKSLLSKNVDLIRGLVNPSASKVTNSTGKLGLRNILMDLRKCLQHPYLVNPELEPQGFDLTPTIVHKNLIDASCKLRFLQMMLPKLKSRGHRVLLFSQFVIVLDIIEDFLKFEGYRFLRLDGDVKQLQRQKDMDTFNQPNSEYFIFMLSTRAGGVGINLWSADTVIIFDPDFNPHQDLQAISRAHRYGQEKTVLVFKLMVKGTAEERIMQTGKKKLALDHVIVQQMDEDDNTTNLQSILTFGAKALFEESENNDITYTESDVDKLILRTEEEGDEVAENAIPGFGFAKLWTADKDVLEEIREDSSQQDQDTTFWDGILAKVTEERARTRAAEVTGRGAKRRAATAVKNYVFDVDSPEKPPIKKRKRNGSFASGSDNAYSDREGTPSSTADQAFPMSDQELAPTMLITLAPPDLQAGPSTVLKPKVNRPKLLPKPLALDNRRTNDNWDDDGDDVRQCGLCLTSHGPGECFMSQNPLNLVEYRKMILTESTEPTHVRKKAINVIDSALASRGLSQLTKGQGNIIEEKTHYKKQKRKSSSPSQNRMIKKHKISESENTPCIVCGGPPHLIKSCPVVKAGSDSISAALERIAPVSNDQAQAVCNILKNYYQKARQEEAMRR